jgi:hypothetical protein
MRRRGGREGGRTRSGPSPAGAGSDGALEELREAYLASVWAERKPVEVEVPFESVAGCAPERVRAAFHYVRHDVTLRPVDLLDADGCATCSSSVPRAG